MIAPDKVIMASALPTYINIGKASANLLVSGTVADSTVTPFEITIPVSSNNSRADIYATNPNTIRKQLISSSNYFAIYQAVSFEYMNYQIIYNTDTITVRLFVNNFSGGPVAIISQNFLIEIVQYQLPI